MVLLLGVAFVAGVVTAVSPCVLPVLPILFAASTTGGRRRPYAIVAGLVLSFTVFTPCAGPVIAAVAVLAATENVSVDAVLVTLAYSLGHGIVLLGLAIAARRGLSTARRRAQAPVLRRALGGAIVAVAVLMVLGLDLRLATRVPAYTRALQGLEESATAQSELERLVGRPARQVDSELGDFGPAPEFQGIERWLNTEPLALDDLRGKVVVIDFWTYSCINCLRTLPHVTRWYETYRDAGLVVIGVHSPEFAFERVPGNVSRAVEDLGIEYPVALDNDFETWRAWRNAYWPTKYFVDRRGRVRYAHVGEGDYEKSEEVIRTLLAEKGLPEPVSSRLPDRTPSGEQTPESYLGWQRLDRFAGGSITPRREATYEIPRSLPLHGLAYGGRWTVEDERIVAGDDARLRLRFVASNVFLVLGTSRERETVEVRLDGGQIGR